VIAGSIGAPELLIALVLVVLLFGSTKLPKLARSLGQAKSELKKAADEKPGDPDADTPTT
jgi:sec-independent protein translocase protein TatA